MKLWTYAELRDKVLKDLDLEDEIFITPEELLGYFNEAVDVVEALIHTLYEDYYFTEANIALVEGQATYDLPGDIYAFKIRAINYTNGTDKYEIKKWRYPLAQIPFVDSQDDYQYLPFNSSAGGYQIKMIPSSRETSASNVTIYYIRNAAVLEDEASICDLPELAINFLLQLVKQRCYEKEGHPNTSKAIDDSEKLRALMVDTLSNMMDDENNAIIKDVEFYTDFDADLLY